MIGSNLPRRLPLLLLLAVLAGTAFLGCDTTEAPSYSNPLDPRNPDSVDPFGLTAVYAAGRVSLEWTVPAGPAIDRIVVEAVISGQPADLDTVGADVTSYVDTSPRGNTENRYRLRGLNAFGQEAQTSHVVPAAVFVPPMLDIERATVSLTDGTISLNRAITDITVLAVAGDVVQMDTLGDFSTTAALPRSDDGATYADFKILKARAEGGTPLPTRDLYVRAGLLSGADQDPSWLAVDTVTVNLAIVTGVGRTGGGSALARPAVDVTLTSGGAGIDSVRFATTEDGLADAPWRPSAESYTDIPMDDTAGPQQLFSQFASSFGDLVAGATLELQADPLENVSINPVLDDSGLVEGHVVTLLPDAVATQMRLSTYPDFRDGPWQEYADTLMFTLGNQAGEQTLYGQFRNHWFLSGIVTETVTVSGAVLDVAFTEPLAGDPVRGGSTVTLVGTAGPLPEGYALTSVAVNLGEGWQEIAADTLWTTTWTAPLFAVDTPWLLGMRAEAAADATGDIVEGVAWIEVTVSQLTVAITAPEQDAEVTSGGPVTLRGTATADLTAAPLDSIVLAVADTMITLTEGLGGWTTVWNATAVADATTETLTATAHAGDDQVSDSVTFSLLPPPDEE